MNEQFSILGNTLFREQELDYGPDNQDNYYIPGSCESIQTGDPNDLFGVIDPHGSWGHFRQTTGSTMGYSYQLKRDYNGKTVNRDNVRLARLHDRISRSRSDYHNKMKYISFTAPLREFFPDQLLGQASQLFEKVQPRLTGKDSDFSCFLASVEFLLIDQGSVIKDCALSEINCQLNLDISRESMLKHRLNIKRACVELYGRKETFKRFHRRGGVIVANRIGELVIDLDIDPSIKSEIRALSREIISVLAAGNYIPKHYTSHAYALLKIICEELGLVDKYSWDSYLDLEESSKKSVYAIAYKLKRRLEELNASNITVPETVVNEVITPDEVAKFNKREAIETVREPGEIEHYSEDYCNNKHGYYLSRQRNLRLLALNIAIGQLTLIAGVLPVEERLMLEISSLLLTICRKQTVMKEHGKHPSAEQSALINHEQVTSNLCRRSYLSDDSNTVFRLPCSEFIHPGILAS